MSLPLKLVVTGLELHADVVLAYVGERKRAHLTIVDAARSGSGGENDAFEEEAEKYPHFKRYTDTDTESGQAGDGLNQGLPNGSSLDHQQHQDRITRTQSTVNANAEYPRAPRLPMPYGSNASPTDIGHKILPNLHIETEIGHADVHVLRNVGKVERFIADVVRKMVVEELVWPNYYTVAM
jgi:distribution and morphology protein 12